MTLSDDEVRAIAAEARLNLTDVELTDAVLYINNFLEMTDSFKELDLKDVEPFCFLESHECPLRDDVPGAFSQPGEIRAQRISEGAFFEVPRIMEE